MSPVKIAPSVLAADLGRLGEQIAEAAEGGADWIHLDVMDGHFVPNLTFGPPIIKAVRAYTRIPFDVHVMAEKPESLIADLADAGADYITVHVEAVVDLPRTIAAIKDAGVKAGAALSPATAVSALDEILTELDLVVVMSVNPGFGGQSFIPASIDKTSRVRAMLNLAGSTAELEVDGGISAANAGRLAGAGASVLVAGSAVYGGAAGVAASITDIRSVADGSPSR